MTSTVKVTPTNNYNKPFGIQEGNVYEAIKVVTSHKEDVLDRYGVAVVETVEYQTISYTVNDMNYDESDFEEVK